MKARGLVIVLSFVFSLFVFSGCQRTDNANVAPVASPTPETIDTAAIEAELTRIENDWPRIMREKDVAAVERLEAEDAVFVYPDGSVGDKSTEVRDMQSGAVTADGWQVGELRIVVLNKDAAVATGRTTITNGKYKMPDGKSTDISGQYRFVDTFVRRDGQWKMAAGVATPIREPNAAASPAASPATKPSPAATGSPVQAASPAASASPGRRPLPPIKLQPRVPPVIKPTP